MIDADIADFGDFKIDPRSGVLEFRSSPDYENPVDEGPDSTYNVVVQATDGDAGDAPEDTRSWFKVTVNVSDLEEPGTITLRRLRSSRLLTRLPRVRRLPRCSSPRLGW